MVNRKPSIHCLQEDFLVVLNELLHDSYSKREIKLLHNSIISRISKFGVPKRSIVITNDKLLKSSTRLLTSSKDDSSKFAHYLLMVRRKLKHKGITSIKPGSRDWLMLKEITKNCLSFCNDFGLTKNDGFKIYIEIALKKMVKYSINKFTSLHQAVCNDYEAINIISTDLSPDRTTLAHSIYGKLVGEKTGIPIDYTRNPEKYQYFILAKSEANKINVPIEHYIKAQFAGLEWANAIPDPAQLVGDKAIQRLQRYLSENKITINKQEEMVSVDWDKILDSKRKW